MLKPQFPGLDSSVSVFILDQASEIVFNGDVGDTSASLPSRRYGIEWTNKYPPNSWITRGSADAGRCILVERAVGRVS
jgi:hypothetical protein